MSSKLFLRHFVIIVLVSPLASSRHLLGAVRRQNVTPNCTPAAINEFPPDGFTRQQRQHGFVVLHALLACYLFTLLAIVCDDYFVPLCSPSSQMTGSHTSH
uniref:Sodium/potassium/calcium exchanger 4 n=1 Tax=Anoplophora glabripennis TaxID=217634 RepID=V5I968_ANOGL